RAWGNDNGDRGTKLLFVALSARQRRASLIMAITSPPAAVEGTDIEKARICASLPLLAEQDHGVHCPADQESRQLVAHRAPPRNRRDGRRYTPLDDHEGRPPWLK